MSAHQPTQQATESLKALLNDADIPEAIREELAAEYAEIEAMIEKLEQGQIHVAVFGRVSVGKSSVLNALLGREAFDVGVLHGTTTESHRQTWDGGTREITEGAIHVIDTPGINELSGEAREKLAYDVASRADLIVFVVDGDLTSIEFEALKTLKQRTVPIILALNKVDRYTDKQRAELLEVLRQRADGLVRPEHIVTIAARPADEDVVVIDADGNEHEQVRTPDADISELRAQMIDIIEREGKSIAALNAVSNAAHLSDEVGKRLTELRKEAAKRITHGYCLAKGVAVGLNPVPVVDLFSAAALDVAMVVQLSRVYGLPMSKKEAGKLIGTIAAQLAVLMGTIWMLHVMSSLLKSISVGASTLITAAAQGAVAWYATLLVAKSAERYLAGGKSWGKLGPRRVMKEIVESLDRKSVIRDAREELMLHLKGRE